MSGNDFLFIDRSYRLDGGGVTKSRYCRSDSLLFYFVPTLVSPSLVVLI